MEVDAPAPTEEANAHPEDSIFIVENPAEDEAEADAEVEAAKYGGESASPAVPSRPTCAFASKPCTRLSVPGYPLCHKHILTDKTAPFKRCTFLHPQTNRRCSTAVSNDSPDPALCRIHKKRALKSSNNTKPSSGEFVAPPPRAPRDPHEQPLSALKKRRALNLEAEKKRDNLLREQALLKMIDSYGPLGKAAVFTTAADLEQIRLRPPTDPAGQELSRKEKIRRLLSSTRMNAIRCEIEAEREFLMTPYQYIQEIESICVQYAKKEVVAPLVIPTESGESKAPPASPAEQPEKKPKFAAKPLDENLSLNDMSGVFSVSDMTPTKPRKKVKKDAAAAAALGEEESEKDAAEKPKKKTSKKKDAVEVPPEPEKPKEVYPTNCTFAGCPERCVPLTHYCFMHILNEPGQLLFQPCEWNEGGAPCGYPIPKPQTPAFCILHMELSQKAAKKTSSQSPAAGTTPAPSSTESDQPPGTPATPSTPADGAEVDTAAKKKKATPRKRKASTETPTEGSEADPAMKPPKPKKPRKNAAEKKALAGVSDPTPPPSPAPTAALQEPQPELVPLLIPKSEEVAPQVNIQPVAFSAWSSLATSEQTVKTQDATAPGPTDTTDDDNPFPLS